ncbi:MAG TPA: hypothetical protein PLR71_09795 [Deltaproteobacteria bacterium]|nr:hypothetical protein [Deltaproteobacteria bacterium]HQI81840.1 hypothetical protein [Deltaproteobacteria bacterium]
MKRLCGIALLFCVAGCAGTQVVTKDFQPDRIIHYPAFLSLGEDAQLDSYAVYLDRGDTFPLELSLKSDIIGFQEKNVNIVVKERVYFTMEFPADWPREKLDRLRNLDREALTSMSESERQDLLKDLKIYVSRDGMHWAAYNDLDTIKELFGIRGGTISLGMGMGNKDGIWSNLDIEVMKQ